MPVIARGKEIVEKDTGKVVGKSKTVAGAKAAARVRNMINATGNVSKKKVPKGRSQKISIASVRG